MRMQFGFNGSGQIITRSPLGAKLLIKVDKLVYVLFKYVYCLTIKVLRSWLLSFLPSDLVLKNARLEEHMLVPEIYLNNVERRNYMTLFRQSSSLKIVMDGYGRSLLLTLLVAWCMEICMWSSMMGLRKRRR